MTVAYRSSAFAANTAATDATSVVVTKPSGTAQGDAMFAIAAGYQTAGTTITPPSGWTAATTEVDSSTGLTVVLYTKTAGGSEPSTYTWSWAGSGGSISVVQISCSGAPADWESFYGVSASNNGTTDPSSANTYSMGTNAGGLVFTGVAFWRNGTNSCTGGANWTEIQDFVRQDGAPGTNWRGQAVYRRTSGDITASGVTTPSHSIDFANAPSGSVKWTFHVPDVVKTTAGASDHTGATSSGTGTITSNPSGSGTSTLGGTTSSGTGQQYITGSGGSNHTGATSDGQGAMQPKGSGTSTLHGALSEGTAAVSGTKLELKVNGVWTDITEKLRHEQGVTITRGKSSSGSKTVTTTCSFRLDNRGHEFNPFNVNGAYYGYLSRNTEIRMTKQEVGVRFWGEIASYEFGTDKSGNDLYVDVECGGMMRRLEQAGAGEKSAMYRDILASYATYSLQNYWPMEGDAEFNFSNVAPPLNRAERVKLPLGIDQLGEGYLQFASYGEAPGSGSLPQIGLSRVQSRYYGLNPTTSNGTTFGFFLASPGGMTASTEVFRVAGVKADGTTGTLYVTYTGTDTYSFNYSSPGSSASVGSLNIPTVGKKGVYFFVCIGPNVAGTAKMKLWYQGVDDVAPVDVCVPIASTDVVDWGGYTLVVNNGRVALSDSSSAYVGHMASWRVSDVPSSTGNTATTLPVISSLNAFLGENAATRFTRLCDEEGVNSSVYGGDETVSKRMGYQKPGDFMTLLRQCEETDGGILYELRDDFGLGYRPLATIYNQDASLELDYEGQHLLNDFQPTYDDQDLTNDVTVTREGGASGRYEITDGRMSTDASPDGIGRYDTSVTLSLYRDEDAYPQAGWRAFLGSYDGVRVTKLSTGLEVPAVDADDALTEQILTVDLGDRLTVANCPSWLSVRDDMLDQILDGYTERWDPTEHRWTYNTSPGRPFQVARAKPVVGSGLRVGIPGGAFLDGTTGNPGSDIDDNDTGLRLVVTLPDFEGIYQSYLQVSDADGDFDIEIGGERMTVTAISDGGSFGVSYTGHLWNLTVTRSVNGIVKSHDNGARVRLWDRPIIGL